MSPDRHLANKEGSHERTKKKGAGYFRSPSDRRQGQRSERFAAPSAQTSFIGSSVSLHLRRLRWRPGGGVLRHKSWWWLDFHLRVEPAGLRISGQLYSKNSIIGVFIGSIIYYCISPYFLFFAVILRKYPSLFLKSSGRFLVSSIHAMRIRLYASGNF